MGQQTSFLTQSRFYSPAFNAAIFDGPLRIYFAQYQEPLALKIYFAAQSRMRDVYEKIREVFRRTGVNIFVMLYPSADSFGMSFSANQSGDEIVVDRLGADYIVGVRGPVSDDDCEKVYARIEQVAIQLANQATSLRAKDPEVAI